MSVSWVSNTEDAEICSAEDIPVGISCGDTVHRIDENNEEIYLDFARSRTEMQLVIDHNALVRPKWKGTDIRHHVGGKHKLWRRVVNLIDVSAFVVQTLCGFPSGGQPSQLFMFIKHSYTVIYSVALILRRIVAYRTTPFVLSPEMVAEGRKGTGHDLNADADIDVLNEMFELLTPPPSMQERALLRVVCAVPEHTYESEQVKGPTCINPGTEEVSDEGSEFAAALREDSSDNGDDDLAS